MSNINEKLREAVALLDLDWWLGQYVDVKVGGRDERRLQVCPKCANDEYKLYVNIEIRVWICYVCGWGTHLNDATVLMSEVSGRSLFDVRKELLQTVRPAPAGDLTEKLQAAFVPRRREHVVEMTEVQLPGSEGFVGVVGGSVKSYAQSRGLSDEEIRIFRLRDAFRLRTFSGPFLVFPVIYDGKAVAWQGRRLGDKEPKYVSSDDIADWLWPIDNLFLSSFAFGGTANLVEGVFDAAGMWRIGEPSFNTWGKKISERQIALLKQVGVKTVRLMWDADATVTSAKKLARGAKGLRGEIESAALTLKNHFHTFVVDLSNPPPFPDIKKPDPGEILRNPGVAEFIRARLGKAMDVNGLDFYQWRLGG